MSKNAKRRINSQTDQKFDKDKWKNNVEKTVSVDWTDIITESPKKCDGNMKIDHN